MDIPRKFGKTGTQNQKKKIQIVGLDVFRFPHANLS
jgi:hypothetical protein